MQKRKNRNRWKMGFSLAELLVVVAILIILAGAGGFAFIQHQRKVRLFGLNNSAKEIFLAAQNHLAVAKASGKWKQLVARDKALEERLSKAMAKPSDFPDDIAWNDDSGRNSFRYLTSDDLSYRSSTVARDYTNAILPAFAVDSTIRGNSFVIEYDEETAVVYGVWYTDVMMPDKKHWKRFSDIEDPDLSPAAYAVLNESRKDENRDKRYQYEKAAGGALLGYYGGSAAVKYSEGHLKALKTLAVTVDNEDALVLNIVNPNCSETKITIHGETSGNEVYRTLHSSDFDAEYRSSITLDNRIILAGPGRPAEKHFKDLFPELIPGEDLTITVTVTDSDGNEESATVETNSLFASIDYARDSSNPERIAYVRNARHLQNLSRAFSGVNSTARDQILITDGSLQDSFDWNESGHAPALRSIENDDLKSLNGNFFTIKNLEIVSDGTGKVGMFAEPPLVTDGSGNPAPMEIIQLLLDHVTIDAPGKASDIGVLVGSVPANGQVTIRDCKIDTVNFPVATNVKNIGGFVGYVSAHASLSMKDCTLSASADPATPIRIRTEAGSAGGIIGMIDPHAAAISLDGVNIDIRQMEVNAKGRDSFAGGVIGDGAGDTLSMKAVEVKAEEGFSIVSTVESAGGLAGRIRAKDVTVESSSFLARTEEGCSADATFPDMINGAKAAGGLIGDCSTESGTAPKLMMTESFASCYVKSGGTLLGSVNAAAFEQAAGGLVGSMKVSAGSLIDKCYYGGRTQGGVFRTNAPYTAGSAADYVQGRWNICVKTSSAHPNVKTLAAGGLIGYLKGPAEIRHSYSTGSVYREKNVTENGSGGLVGMIADGSGAFAIENCYSTGLVYTSDGLTAVGGFAGTQPGTGTFSGDFFLQGVNYNQTLEGAGAGAISDVTKATTGDGSAFFAAARAEAKWKDRHYDASLNNALLKDADENPIFPYKTVDQLDGGDTRNEVKYHTGDWTVPEALSKITGDFGLIYYERIVDDPNIYYEGYMCERKDPTAPYSLTNMAYHYVSSAGNDKSRRGSIFVTEHGKYIYEDGYLLIENEGITDLNLAELQVADVGLTDFNSRAYGKIVSHTFPEAFTEYTDMESKLSLEGYKVYAYRYISTTNAYHPYQSVKNGTVLILGTNLSAYSGGQTVAAFGCVPFFADEIHAPDDTGISMERAGIPNGDGTYYYRIRSARQLNLLAALDGSIINSSYLTDKSKGHNTVKQDLDISYNVPFTMCGDDGTTVSANESIKMIKGADGVYENQSFANLGEFAVFEASKGPDGEYYTLSHLRKPLFAGALFGTLQNLHITNSKFSYLAQTMNGATGLISGVYINNSSFTSLISDAMFNRIEDLHITNSTFTYLAQNMNGTTGLISGVYINNSSFTSLISIAMLNRIENLYITTHSNGSYLVDRIDNSTGVIDGVHISDSNIDDLVITNSGTVRDVQVTGSIISDLVVNNSGTVQDVHVTGSTLSELIQDNWSVLTLIRIANSTLDYLVKTINWGGSVTDYQITDSQLTQGLYETNHGTISENP